MQATRLYLDDDHCYQADATARDARDCALALDRGCCRPGGGRSEWRSTGTGAAR